MIPTKYYSVIKKKMRWGLHVARMGQRRAAYRGLVGRSEGKRPCRRPRCRWEEHTKVGVKEVGWGVVEEIDLA